MMNSQNEIFFSIISESPQQTIKLGVSIGSALKGGEIITLTGPLGSGKTQLVKGIAQGADTADEHQVNSPTFVLINEYSRPDGSLDIYHIDAYRLNSTAEFEKLGFDDLCYPASVVLIEWADKVQPAFKNIDTIDIELQHMDKKVRKIEIKNLPLHIRRQINIPNQPV